jgi:hypothetical protein
MKRSTAVVALTLGAMLLSLPALAQVASLTLEWTAPGDDAGIGTAQNYEARFSVTRPDTTSGTAMAAWWAAATVIPNLPAPAVAGTVQSVGVVPVGGFLGGNTYYFVLRARDDAGNWSAFSNVAFRAVPDTLPPRTVVDLRVR